MRIAGKVNLEAIQKGMEVAKPGVTLREIDAVIEDHIKDNFCQPSFKGYKGYPAASCISPNNVVVHGVPGDYELQTWDLVTIDVGTRHNGYTVDAARTFIVDGPMDDKLSDPSYYSKLTLLKAAEYILEGQLSVVKAGCSLEKIVDISEERVKGTAYNIMPQWLGHGIGEEIHMPPSIPSTWDRSKGELNVSLQKRISRNILLTEGQTICLEPVVTYGNCDIIMDEDGWTIRTTDNSLVAHTERCVIVTEDGYELLT
jgi:methionyl aminopeptidase